VLKSLISIFQSILHLHRVHSSHIPHMSAVTNSLVVDWVSRVGQIKHNTAVRLSTTSGRREVRLKVNGAVEVQASIRVDVNVERLEISRGVDEADVASLYEVVGDDDVLLVGGHLDVVGTNAGLDLIRVVETLDVVEVADVEGGDVVGSGEGQVDELSVLGDVGAVKWVVSGF